MIYTETAKHLIQLLPPQRNEATVAFVQSRVIQIKKKLIREDHLGHFENVILFGLCNKMECKL